MAQHLTSNPIPKEIYSTLTSKGQVTIPAQVRRHLGIHTNDKIAFVIQPEGTVQVKTPKYPTIASLAGEAGKLKKPLSWQEVEATVHDDRAAYKKKNG
jgi:antitoxin PrlF